MGTEKIYEDSLAFDAGITMLLLTLKLPDTPFDIPKNMQKFFTPLLHSTLS